MNMHTVSRAAILAFLVAAAGLYACSSDKTKADDTSGGATAPTNSSGATTSSNESMDAPAPTTTSSSDSFSGRNSAYSTADSNVPSDPAPASSTGDVAAMETPQADQASGEQSQEYEKSQRK